MAKVRAIRAEVGLSIDKNGVWIKGSAAVEVNLDPEDDIKACFKRAYEHADAALTEEMEELQNPKEDLKPK